MSSEIYVQSFGRYGAALVVTNFMTPSGKTICLCMIVKNEAPVIRRCLESVRPIIDSWVVVDTGSTDGTQAIIQAALQGLPGALHERPWRDFAANRTEALAFARLKGDYSLIIDADDTLETPADFCMPDLDADSYTIDIDFGGTRYVRPHIVKNTLPWRYEGVIHEFLTCDDAAKASGHLPLVMRISQDGARRRDPDIYRKDAEVLERALVTEDKPLLISRYTFYLAQSYRDCGEKEKALNHYLRRAELGFWNEEIYCSLLAAGRLMEQLGRPADAVLATYERATQVVPWRAEALHAASRLLRFQNEYRRGLVLGRRASDLALPSGLFVETWIYDYGALDEHAVNAYWSGAYRECVDTALRALLRGKMPTHEAPRFLQNMRFALDKIPGGGPLVVPDAVES